MSKILKEDLPKAALILLIFSIICGLLYTLAVTGISQLLFSDKANGSIVEVNGKKYGSELLAQQFNDEKHMWGRIMNVDTKTFTDKDGSPVMYASPSNLTPAGETKQKDKGELKADERACRRPCGHDQEGKSGTDRQEGAGGPGDLFGKRPGPWNFRGSGRVSDSASRENYW